MDCDGVFTYMSSEDMCTRLCEPSPELRVQSRRLFPSTPGLLGLPINPEAKYYQLHHMQRKKPKKPGSLIPKAMMMVNQTLDSLHMRRNLTKPLCPKPARCLDSRGTPKKNTQTLNPKPQAQKPHQQLHLPPVVHPSAWSISGVSPAFRNSSEHWSMKDLGLSEN